jgi:hypothetical protein
MNIILYPIILLMGIGSVNTEMSLPQLKKIEKKAELSSYPSLPK